jgi:hypothetical protein
MSAGEAGADYVAFGAFFPTTTKETKHTAKLSTLACWQTVFEIPASPSAASSPRIAALWCARAPISSPFPAPSGMATRWPMCRP